MVRINKSIRAGQKTSSSVGIVMDVSRPWSDLPYGIVETIINKLHFTDQVRALSVCKSWRASKDYIKSSDCFPWVVCREGGDDYVIGKLADPYLLKVFPKVYKGHSYLTGETVLASCNGWLLLDRVEIESYLLHNPFTRDIILLPISFINMGATMVSHNASECEIFALSYNYPDYSFTMETYRFSKNDGSVGHYTSHTFDDMGQMEFFSMLYMKGSVYVYFEDVGIARCVLMRYNLEDKSWKSLNEGFPYPNESMDDLCRCWLIEMNENLMMVRLDRDESFKWTIFRFDWSKMSWVTETGLRGCAIFISGRVAFSEPLTDRDGKPEECCKLFYGNIVDGDNGFKCCSLNEAGGVTNIQSHEYERIERIGRHKFNFVKPPYFGI